MAVVKPNQKMRARCLTPNNTLTSGITKVNAALPIVSSIVEMGAPGSNERYTVIRTNSLIHAIASDAAEAFGEHIATFPLGRIQPLGASIVMTSLCDTGLSATAGEVGLGSVIGSGAAATLGTTTLEDIMEGTTLSNHVAATTLTSKKANGPSFAGGTTATDGVRILDGSGTATKLHLNIASTWNQTAAENFTFSAEIHLHWRYISTGLAS